MVTVRSRYVGVLPAYNCVTRPKGTTTTPRCIIGQQARSMELVNCSIQDCSGAQRGRESVRESERDAFSRMNLQLIILPIIM